MKEQWDIYDKNLNKTGKVCIRDEYKLKENEYHLVVHIWIISKEGKLLLAQRSANKRTDPLKWECTGGSVLYNEEPIDAAIREVSEELGLKLNKNEIKLFDNQRRDWYHDFYFAYYVIKDKDIINKIKFTDGEAIDKKWVTRREFNELYNKEEIVNNLYYIKEFDNLN